jgi:hypothetical protein
MRTMTDELAHQQQNVGAEVACAEWTKFFEWRRTMTERAKAFAAFVLGDDDAV